MWKETVIRSEKDLLEILCIGICEKLNNIERRFWAEVQQLQESKTDDHFKDWLIKLLVHLEKKIKKNTKTKRKKLEKLTNNEYLRKLVSERFDENLDLFTFPSDLLNYCENVCPDVVNIANLVTLNSPTRSSLEVTNYNNNNIYDKEEVNLNDSVSDRLSNAASSEGNRYKANFVSPNVINLSKRNLVKDKISLLSKGLQFVPTPKHFNKALLLKEELENFGRKRLKWFFRNDERQFNINPVKQKSKFNPRKNDAAIEFYLNRLDEEILSLDKKISYSNLTKGERNDLHSLKDDTSIIIKEADKGSGAAVWDREDYLAETKKQLDDKDVYQELRDVKGPLEKITKKVIRKLKNRGDISHETIDYFSVNNPKLGRFYLHPKIHKRLHDVPGRPIISNSGFYTENISSFIEYHLKPLAQNVKSYIKYTNDFLSKLASLPPLPDDVILCTIDVVGLYIDLMMRG